jgi:hypothetical protein
VYGPAFSGDGTAGGGTPTTYVRSCGNNEQLWNLIEVRITTSVAVAANASLVIEVPTMSLDGSVTLFANDLGTGLQAFGIVPIDILETGGSSVPSSFVCRLFPGLQA